MGLLFPLPSVSMATLFLSVDLPGTSGDFDGKFVFINDRIFLYIRQLVAVLCRNVGLPALVM